MPIPVSQSGFELGALIPEIKYWSHQSGCILKTKSRKQIEITLTILTRKYEQATRNVDRHSCQFDVYSAGNRRGSL
jgi:hypothetical protein